MKAKVLLLSLAILLLASSAMALGPEKKFGYGFQPGLVPGKDFVAGQLIVGLKQGVSPAGIKRDASAAGIQIAREIQGALLLRFNSEQAALEAASALAGRPDVAFVERNGFMRIPQQPRLSAEQCGGCKRAPKGDLGIQSVSDTWAPYQWHLTVIRKSADLGSVPDAPPTVALIDTGVDYQQNEVGKILVGKNCVANNMEPLDDHGQGTHAAGIIGARVNGYGGEGVCQNCWILAVKVLGGDGTGSFFDIADGMQYARTYTNASYPPVKIINLNVAGPDSALIAAEVLAIKTAGKVLVAPAGDGNTTVTTNAYPGADLNTALRVMATNEVDCRAWFSNFSPSTAATQYNIAAPGWKIYSTLLDGGFGTLSGTSSASSVVAGVAALVWGRYPSFTPAQLVSRLRTYGRGTSCGFPATVKRVDLRKALLGTAETGILGDVRDPFTGLPPLHWSNTTVELRSGTTLLASDTANIAGWYEMTGLTAGNGRTLKAIRVNYIPTVLRDPVTIPTGGMTVPFLDAFPQARPTGNASIILDWKSSQPTFSATGLPNGRLGWELDLWVKLPDGTYVGRDNTGDLLIDPYVKFPRDSAKDLLPMETIVIDDTAANGEYKIFVEKPVYSGPKWNPLWTSSLASVQVYNGSTELSPYYGSPPSTCESSLYWHIGNLTKNGTSMTWVGVNACTNTKP